MGRKLGLAAAVLAALAVAGGLLGRGRWAGSAPAASLSQGTAAWIIDAGHGGEDGGAVSPGGAVESRINLEIARRLDGILGFLGESALMLREEDVSLHDPEAVSLREKKASDLHNRAEAAARSPEATLVSIHQNTFPSPNTGGPRCSTPLQRGPGSWPRAFRGPFGVASSRTTAGRAGPSRRRSI